MIWFMANRNILTVTALPIVSLFLGLMVTFFLVYNKEFGLFFVLNSFLSNALGDSNAISEIFIIFPTLSMVSVGVLLALKCGFWNIGGDGQLHIGALGITAWSVWFGEQSPWLGIPLSFLFSILLAGTFCWFLAYLKVTKHVDEILLTILSNFIVLYGVAYLVSGPLQDPVTQWIQSPPLSHTLRVPRISPDGRAHYAIFVSIFIFITVIFLEKRSFWNVFLKLVADNPYSARLVGYNPRSVMLAVAFLSGGICGIAGWIEVAAVQYRLIADLSPAYGYFALLIAVFSRGSFIYCFIFSICFSIVLNGLDGVIRDALLPSYSMYITLGVIMLSYMLMSKNSLLSRYYK